ncbi:MAG: phage capsid protein, partial [Gammaproteobacteria bacterium]|nr:phage capsid protein [Gammaproteobacteria bacterium]
VTFPASVSPTQREIAESVQMLNAAQAASVDTRVRMVHPDWTDTQVTAEVEKIMTEQSMTTPTMGLPGIDEAVGGGA